LLAILVSGLDIIVGSLAALADVSRWRASPKKSIVTLLFVVVLFGVLVVPFCLQWKRLEHEPLAFLDARVVGVLLLGEDALVLAWALEQKAGEK
jgi:hypothetical protein